MSLNKQNQNFINHDEKFSKSNKKLNSRNNNKNSEAIKNYYKSNKELIEINTNSYNIDNSSKSNKSNIIKILTPQNNQDNISNVIKKSESESVTNLSSNSFKEENRENLKSISLPTLSTNPVNHNQIGSNLNQIKNTQFNENKLITNTYKENSELEKITYCGKSSSLSVYKVLGSENKLYCQNLSLISKLFLDHKSIYFDVSPFVFYVLTENDDDTNRSNFVGYFSKELSPLSDFNLACIMVLPPYQKSGYGQFLIALSYHFSKIENKIGTPECPLSDLGRLSYKSYWTIVLLEVLVRTKCNVTLRELSENTHIKYEDVLYTMNELNLIKYWRGQQVLQTVNQKQLEEFLKKKKLSKTHHVKFNTNYFL